MVIVAAVVYFLMNLYLFLYVDCEGCLNRMRAADVLSEDVVERMESILADEEAGNPREISVPTDQILRNYTTDENF